MRILVVDDDNGKVVDVVKVVEQAGIDSSAIEVATTAASALKMLEANTYDLLVVDLVLPRRIGEPPIADGGAELVQKIHRSDSVRVPEFIVGLTADREALERSMVSFSNLLWSIELSGNDQTQWKVRLQQKLHHLRSREQQREPTGFEKVECDVLFVCALPEPELSELHKASEVSWEQCSFDFDSNLYWKSAFERDGRKITAFSTSLPQMGLVAASTAVSQAVRTLSPKVVVMSGICAGRKGDCELGDVIAASITWDYGSGKFIESDGVVVFEPAPIHVLVDATIQSCIKGICADPELVKKFYESCPGFRPGKPSKVHFGPMASGAAVQNYRDFFTGVADQNRKILGVDMEAFGVAWACHQSVSPCPKWLVVKGVSDFADGSKNNEFQSYSSFMSAKVAIEIALRTV